MRFGILGPTELDDGQTSYPLGPVKQRGLLALLLLHAGRPVRIDTLVEHLWPDGGSGDRRKILYSMVSRLRAVLGRSGVRFALTRVGSGYRLDVPPSSVDFHEFRSLVERSREPLDSDRPDVAVADLERAVELWRGEPLAELRGPAAEHLRRQLTDTLLDAHKLLATARLRTGRHQLALGQLEELVRDHELDASLARLWVGALSAVGREDDARRYLATFRRRFRRELSVDPQAELAAIVFRSPGSPADRPHQLPYSVPGFVGRSDLLAELDTLAEPGVDRPNVVVLTGMPGIGKTTLAVHWAHRNAELFRDGQLFLDAGAFGPGPPIDPKEALARFLHALGLPPDRIPESIEDRRQRFNDLLSGRRVLILLDNVADSVQVRPLITSASTCLTIVTSRRRLSSLTIREGVRNLHSSPLGDREADLLLAQIVGERRAAREPAAMARLAGIAAGLPLALRIVGEQVAERPRARVAELAQELQEQLLWAGVEGDGLDFVFGWSYRSLGPEAAVLFRRLALHPGGRISLEAATALSGTDLSGTERTLNLLARANLVEHDTVRHYRLHDLLHQYAEARGAEEDTPAETAACRLAIATWFLCSAARAAAILAPQLPPVPDLPAVPRHVMEFATEEAALSWCLSERENLALAARYAGRHGMHRHAWQLPAAVHDIFTRTGRYDDLIRSSEIAMAEAGLDRHVFGEIASGGNLGQALCAVHQYDRAITVLTAACDRAAKSGDTEAEIVVAHNLASALLKAGATTRAIDIFLRVRAETRRLANPFGESVSLVRLGDAFREQGRGESALAAYSEAFEIRRRIGSVRGEGLIRNRLSAWHLDAGDLHLADEHCAAALEIHDRIHDEGGRCDALITRADIARIRGAASAVADARAALEAGTALGDSYKRVQAMAILAESLASAGRADEGATIRAEGLRIAAELGGPDAAPLLKRLLAGALGPLEAGSRHLAP